MLTDYGASDGHPVAVCGGLTVSVTTTVSVSTSVLTNVSVLITVWVSCTVCMLLNVKAGCVTVSPGLVIVRITRLAGSTLNARVTVWPCLVRHRTTVTVLPRALVLTSTTSPVTRRPLASLRTT